jgi:pyruvate/2-oxoacid:ferredoxin oxidoreductase beta subunit
MSRFAPVVDLAARRRSITVEDALASIHAGAIADYLAAALVNDRQAMSEVLDRAARLDAKHPGGPSLIDQLTSLRTHTAA